MTYFRQEKNTLKFFQKKRKKVLTRRDKGGIIAKLSPRKG